MEGLRTWKAQLELGNVQLAFNFKLMHFYGKKIEKKKKHKKLNNMQGAAKKSLSAGGKLSAILDTKLSEATPYKFSLDQVRSVGVNTLKRAFEENGVLCITDAFTHEAFNEAQSLVKQAFMTDVFPQLSIPLSEVENRTIFDIAARKELWKTGIVGNKGFGYLFAQPEAKEDVFRKNIDGQNIAFQMGSAYKANLALIAHETSQLTLATLLSVTGNKFGMISQDSAKVHRETLTEPHIDKYGEKLIFHPFSF